LGAMFYEMVTDRKAFDREDADSLRQSILESTPVPPMHVNPKLHPVLSDLIMKALAKDPAERFQNGRELLDELEKCKESKPQAAKAAAAPAKGIAVPTTVKAAAQTKFAGASAPGRPAAPKAQPAAPVQSKPVEKKFAAPAASAPGKAAAAAAGSAGGRAVSSAPVKPVVNEPEEPSAYMSSSAVDEPTVEAPADEAPTISVDPMMAEGGPSKSGGISFSEMTELPPLKEIYIPPPPPPPVVEQKQSHAPTVFSGDGEEEPEKPKVQPRVVAQKAMKEIKNVPPQLMIYSIAGAAVLILIIAVVLVLHVNTLNSDGDTPRPVAAEPAPQPAAEPSAQPAPAPQSQAAAPVQAQPEAEAPAQVAEPEPTHVAAAAARGKNGRKKPAPAPAIVPGQMAIDSTPQGAQVQVDGRTDPSWVTPFALTGLAAGAHTVTVSKAGYSTDTRTVNVASGSKAFVTSHLSQQMATLAVTSSPAGADVFIDGKNTGRVTPAQVPVDKGQHVILIRKSGYIDQTTSAQFALGQTTNFSPTLQPLGNVDDIKTVGKMNKLFGGKD